MTERVTSGFSWYHSDEFSKTAEDFVVSLLLKAPIPMSYEVWWYLHSIKGDI